MKNILFIFLFIAMSTNLFSKNSDENTFYYYKSEKIFLQENSNRILLKVSMQSDNTDLIRRLDSNSNYRILRSDIRQGEYIVLESHQGISYEAQQASLRRIKETRGVISANFMLFLSNKNHFVGFADEFFVKLDPTTTNDEFNQLLNQYGCEVVLQDQYDGDIFKVKVTSTSQKNAIQTSVDFYDTGLFEFAEPNLMQKTITYTNDPLFGEQWALDNTGQIGGTPGADIDILGAWQFTKGRADIRIAVVDGGVQLDHPDLVGNLVSGFDASGNSTNGGPVDGETHGTNCAGIISAVADNGIGLAGVANECALVPISFDVLDAFDSEVVDAINLAWDQGRADVISNSWGRFTPSSMIDAAINNASVLGRDGLGSVVLFAVGNENDSQIAYPSNLPSVIAVGASDACDRRWIPTACDGEILTAGSNRGNVDFVAPGYKLNTTHNGGGYAKLIGTSAATPVAAGVAGLVLSINPCLTRDEVKQILELSCDKPIFESALTEQNICYNFTSGRPHGTWNNEVGYGRVNAHKAVQYAHSQNLTVGNNIGGISDGGTDDDFSWTLIENACIETAAASYIVYRYEVHRDITFPLNYFPVVHANSSGFSAASPNGGTQWADVQNLTTTSARLRTFTYYITSTNGQVAGWAPAPPANIQFHYFVTDGNLIPNIYLQNDIVSSGTHNHLATNLIWSGRNVTSAVPIGDYVVQGSANVDLRARNEIELRKGTIITPSSTGSFQAEIQPFFTCPQYPMGKSEWGSYDRVSSEHRSFTQTIAEFEEVDENPDSHFGVYIYPNPTDGLFTINVDFEGNTKVEVFTIRGEQVSSSTAKSNRINLDISNQKPGIYLVKITTNNKVTTKKIMKK